MRRTDRARALVPAAARHAEERSSRARESRWPGRCRDGRKTARAASSCSRRCIDGGGAARRAGGLGIRARYPLVAGVSGRVVEKIVAAALTELDG